MKNLTVKRHKFIAAMVAMKTRAGELGLYRTMQAMDKATHAVGWELADLIEHPQRDVVAQNKPSATAAHQRQQRRHST